MAGNASQPVSGAVKPHRFLNRTTKRVVSKSREDTEVHMWKKIVEEDIF